MGAEILLLGGAAAAAVVVTVADTKAPPPSQLNANGGVKINVPAPGSSVKPGSTGTAPTAHFKMATAGRLPNFAGTHETGIHATATSNTGVGSGTNSDDPQINGKLQTIDAGAKVAYDALSTDAKQKGAAAVNSALGTDLTGNEDYEKVASVVGGALGGAAGGYIGGPYGAKLGAIVGAYLGVKLEDLLAKNWDELQSWVSSKWDDVSSYVSDNAQSLADEAESDVGDAYDYVSGWV